MPPQYLLHQSCLIPLTIPIMSDDGLSKADSVPMWQISMLTQIWVCVPHTFQRSPIQLIAFAQSAIRLQMRCLGMRVLCKSESPKRHFVTANESCSDCSTISARAPNQRIG